MKARQMEGVLEDLMTLRNNLERIPQDMIREASFATTSGEPSPVFHPLINASTAAITRLQESLDAVHYRVHKDLMILLEMSKQVEGLDLDVAAGIDAADAQFAPAIRHHDAGSEPWRQV